MMEAYFETMTQAVQQALGPGERFTATFDAEDTDFVRMNRGKVRQPGTVSQRYLSVRLIEGRRHAEHTMSLTGIVATDLDAVREAVATLRAAMPELADDPLLLLPTNVQSSRNAREGSLPPAEVGRRRDPACRGRHRPRRHLRGRPDLPRLREFRRPAQLARHDRVQPAVEPLSPRRQGREDRVCGFRVGRRRFRAQDERGARAPGPHRPAFARARARQVPRVPDAVRHGGDCVDPVLGRILRPRARHQTERAREDAGRRSARSARVHRRGHGRRRVARVPGGRIRAARRACR